LEQKARAISPKGVQFYIRKTKQAGDSFLVSVSVILAVALFVPCIESIVRFVRRSNQTEVEPVAAAQPKPSKSFSREAA
jgi:hypothetical protein